MTFWSHMLTKMTLNKIKNNNKYLELNLDELFDRLGGVKSSPK